MSNLIHAAKSSKISLIGKNSDQLAAALGVENFPLEQADGAIFLVSAEVGIVSADIASWHTARELYIPSLVVISDLTSSEIDFEDMSAIASKMLDPVVTPYLVLHGDDGSAAALIDLETLAIFDFSSGVALESPASSEHIELVAEFREEYLEQISAAGEASFEAGLLFPAIPWVPMNGIGLTQIRKYLDLIPAVS